MEVFIIIVVAIIVLGIILFLGRKRVVPIDEKEVVDEAVILEHNKKTDFKMVVDDVFTIAGKGTVVTGTIENGLVSIHDELELYGENGFKRKVSVRGLEMFRKTLEYAQAGDNVGLLLADITNNEITRGDTLSIRR